ncbi:Aste57867_10013 [Aphanomyces stellatus]|uniref:Nuclear pore complex protein n=1 Tax=Aphanomyces stellatus TaxID=120398 RepID=A0A485KPN7_9STRA|nr:hypothetical protein As57867_009974 [Aphanomyces stellatus]VFT86891.1 Aste57867_10013 [Aphanomyces stellatus]
MADTSKRTNDLILAAESSLALLAELDKDDQERFNDEFDMDTSHPMESENNELLPEGNPSPLNHSTLDYLGIMGTSSVEKSVLDGLAHVKVQFPDRSVEYVDVRASSTTVGETLALAWKKRHHTIKFLDKKKMRGVFQGQEVANDWLLLDCGLALEGILQLHMAPSIDQWKATAPPSFFGDLSISSISSAYNVESEGTTLSDKGVSKIVGTKPAEWMEQQIRPEEYDFANALEEFYLKFDMEPEPNALCQKILMDYIDILQNQIEKKERSTTTPFQLHALSAQGAPDTNLCEELRHERNTWRLLFDLRSLSMNFKSSDFSAESLPLDYQTTEMDAIATLERSSQYYALQKTVLNWLEFVASEHVSSTSERRNMHSRTLRHMKQRSTSVSMDPDGTLREGDCHLDDDDAEDEFDLLKSVWLMIRAGKTKEASNLCIQLGQPWRAATLCGNEICGSCENDDSQTNRWGNPFRMLWKQMCWQFAEAPLNEKNKLSKNKSLEAREYESMVYASLSGHANVLLHSPLCESWEDHCWALLQAAMNFQQDELLLRLLKLKLKSTQLITENKSDYLQIYEAFMEQTKPIIRFNSGLNTLFDEIAVSSSNVVREQADHPHRRIQSKLVTSDIDSIVSNILKAYYAEDQSDFSWDLNLESTTVTNNLPPQLLRFAAHFVLFMSITGESFDVTTGYLIQKAYIRHLIKHAHHKLVALYASRLPDEGRESIYVQLLTSLRDKDARNRCLKSIAKYCSSQMLSQITKQAVELIFQKDSDQDTRIEALELLCFDPTHRAELLRQVNCLSRQFIAEDKQNFLKPLLHAIPVDSLTIIKDSCRRHFEETSTDGLSFCWRQYLQDHAQMEQAIREFLSWKSFVDATEAYENWRDCMGQAHHGKTCYAEEECTVKELTFQATKAISALFSVLQFEGGWLQGCVEGMISMRSIQSTCIPFVCFSLHRVCADSIEWMSKLQYYQPAAKSEISYILALKAMQLSHVVANEQYKVYQAFSKDQMKYLLQLLHNSAVTIISLKNTLT